MSVFTKFNGKVRVICIWETRSAYDAFSILDRQLHLHMVDPEDYTRAVVGIEEGTSDSENSKSYPLKFYNKAGTEEIWISKVSAGKRGEASAMAIGCLERMGFKVSDRAVYELSRGELLTYTK